MFGFKSEPSAEALAGVGPTATYPVSPSASVTPEAIASTAAGTTAPGGIKPQTATYASVTPGVTPQTPGTTSPGVVAQSPNLAAAAANGFYGKSATGAVATSPATYAQAAGTGYTYGQNPAVSGANPVASVSGGINAIAAGYVPPAKPASSAAAVPAYAQTPTATPPTTPATAYAASPGYPLPGSAAPQPSAPTGVASTVPSFSMPPIASTTEAAKTSSAGGFMMPTAPAAPTVAATTPPAEPAAYQAAAPSKPSAPTVPTTGYTPGSTAGAVSYPSNSGYPATGTSDSFYR